MVEKDYKTKAKWKYELQMLDRKGGKSRPITLPRYKFMEKKSDSKWFNNRIAKGKKQRITYSCF